MSKLYDIAVVGATGVVGETVLELLQARHFPIRHVYALASERSRGKKIIVKDQEYTVSAVSDFDFSKVQLAFFSAGSDCSATYVPKATQSGCVVIDNTSYFRYEPDVPLVIPEVNPEALRHFRHRHIIANPNCSTIQLLVALKPIYDLVGLSRINVVTCQSVSGAGRLAIQELAHQTTQILKAETVASPSVFPLQIAFNVLPHIDLFQDNHYTKEEMKMVWETQKILGDPHIRVNATAIRVPVFFGHSEAVHIEAQRPIQREEAHACLSKAPGIILMDEDHTYPTAATHAAHADAVFVGRVRNDISHPCGLNLWIVADNIRKGAALNAIQIAEHLIAPDSDGQTILES